MLSHPLPQEAGDAAGPGPPVADAAAADGASDAPGAALAGAALADPALAGAALAGADGGEGREVSVDEQVVPGQVRGGVVWGRAGSARACAPVPRACVALRVGSAAQVHCERAS